MDTIILNNILNWQLILFCLAISATTYVVRIIVNFILLKYNIVPKDCHLWENLALPILPVFIGSIGALLVKQYPYPIEISSYSGRFIFGLAAGLLSGFIWRIIKAGINSKINAFKTIANNTTDVLKVDVGKDRSEEEKE